MCKPTRTGVQTRLKYMDAQRQAGGEDGHRHRHVARLCRVCAHVCAGCAQVLTCAPEPHCGNMGAMCAHQHRHVQEPRVYMER